MESDSTALATKTETTIKNVGVRRESGFDVNTD